MKKYIFFVVTIVIGTITYQSIVIGQKQISIIQQKIQDSELSKPYLVDYVEKMVEFPITVSQESFVKTLLLSLFRLTSKRKESMARYLTTIKSLYYYFIGSLFGFSDTLFSLFRRK